MLSVVIEICQPYSGILILDIFLMENQARLGWLIDRKNPKVEIYRQDWDVEIFDNPATLSGEDVLPGFVLDLTEVW